MSMLSVQKLQKSFLTNTPAATVAPDSTQAIQVAGKKGPKRSRATVLHEVSFDVQPGEMFTLLGPSGCGKSTTLRSIAGLESPDDGKIEIAGNTVFSGADRINLEANERDLSMVFQSYAIWPHLNVFKNVSFPLEVRNRKNRFSRKQIAEKVEAALDAVDLSGFGSRPATKMSGGQQQRLALARALVTQPDLILLDEPLSNLDVKLREHMRLELKRMQQQLGLTAIYVTHDQGEALALSSRIAVMNGGKIEQIGTPREIYQDPQSLFVAQFVGTSNIFEGRVSQIAGDVAEIETKQGKVSSRVWSGLSKGDTVTLMIRPEDIVVKDVAAAGADANGWVGTVLTGAYIGEAVDYLVDVQGKEISCRVDPRQTGRVGTECFMHVDPTHVHVLPGAPRRA